MDFFGIYDWKSRGESAFRLSKIRLVTIRTSSLPSPSISPFFKQTLIHFCVTRRYSPFLMWHSNTKAPTFAF